MNSDPQPSQRVQRESEAIARAFRLSVLGLVGVVVIAVIAWFIFREGTPPAQIDPTVAAPDVAAEDTEAPEARFVRVTEASGIDFVHENGASGDRLLPETMGSGVALFDYDNDGDVDIFFLNSSRWSEDGASEDAPPTARLYRNEGGWNFTDVSAKAGLDVECYGMGIAVADYDADGWTDLYITAVGPDRLFRNVNGRFVDVTETAGVGGKDSAWSTAAAFFDADGDLDLDLFVCEYIRWSRDIDLAVDFRFAGLGRGYGPPGNFEGSHPRLYLNEGDGRFRDASEDAGIRMANASTGFPIAKALGIGLMDVDDDGRLDVFVANDTTRNMLFRNLGEGVFKESGILLGLAYDSGGGATGAMGVDVAHYRNDESLGVLVGNYANEPSSMFVRQTAGSPFTDEATIEGIGAASRGALTFGVLFIDYDLDGWADVLQCNGHLEDRIGVIQPSQSYEQPAQLFHNMGASSSAAFARVPDDRAGDLALPIVGRASATADLDGDGDLDVVLTALAGPPSVLRNDTEGGNWLRVRVVGLAPNLDAIGATVEIHGGGMVQSRIVSPTRGYLSQSELTLTFGLGVADTVERVSVRWPNGDERTLEKVSVNQTLTVKPGEVD